MFGIKDRGAVAIESAEIPNMEKIGNTKNKKPQLKNKLEPSHETELLAST